MKVGFCQQLVERKLIFISIKYPLVISGIAHLSILLFKIRELSLDFGS